LAAGLHLNRLASGLSDDRIDWAASEQILAPISAPVKTVSCTSGRRGWLAMMKSLRFS
jgi:hypothetical protein